MKPRSLPSWGYRVGWAFNVTDASLMLVVDVALLQARENASFVWALRHPSYKVDGGSMVHQQFWTADATGDWLDAVHAYSPQAYLLTARWCSQALLPSLQTQLTPHTQGLHAVVLNLSALLPAPRPHAALETL